MDISLLLFINMRLEMNKFIETTLRQAITIL